MTTLLAPAPIKDTTVDELLWDAGMVTDHGMMVYTEGDCWALAYAMSTLMGQAEGVPFKLYTLGRSDSWWHVVVRVGENAYLDATGIKTGEQLEADWGRRLSAVMHGNADSWATFMDYLTADWCFGPREAEAEAVARVLLEAHAPHLLVA